MIEEQNNLFYQYEKIVNLKNNKRYDEDSGGYIKKSTSYKTII